MKLINLILFVLVIAACSDSDTSTEPEGNGNQSEILEKFFPYQDGKFYEFSIDTLNNSNNEFYAKGSRVSSYSSDTKIADYNYLICDQKFNFNSTELLLKTHYRITENSVNLLADTSRVWEVIPDTLRSIVSITVEDEIILLQLPLEDGARWPVVKAYVDFQTFKFNTVDVEATYLGKESLSISNFSNLETAVVEYKLDINSPDLENPFLSHTETFFAKIWFSEEYGIVKMEGCSFMLNIVVGYPMNFGHLEASSRQILINKN